MKKMAHVVSNSRGVEGPACHAVAPSNMAVAVLAASDVADQAVMSWAKGLMDSARHVIKLNANPRFLS